MKNYKVFENLWNTMKVLKGQEANLESSKGFYRSIPKSMKIPQIRTFRRWRGESYWKGPVRGLLIAIGRYSDLPKVEKCVSIAQARTDCMRAQKPTSTLRQKTHRDSMNLSVERETWKQKKITPKRCLNKWLYFVRSSLGVPLAHHGAPIIPSTLQSTESGTKMQEEIQQFTKKCFRRTLTD